jgi:DNA adenine methylase
MAAHIHRLAPPHIHRVIPFAGGLGELWGWECEGVSEVVNDINGELTNFWEVLAHPLMFEKLQRILEATPVSEVCYDKATKSHAQLTDLFDGRIPNGVQKVDRAANFFVRCRQSMSGRMKSFSPLSRTRTRRGMNELASAWWNAIDGLPDVHARLARVVVLNRPAVDVIRQQDGPDTLFYCDPPYMPDTRTAPDVYQHEMTAGEHAELLDVLLGCEGKVMLSGYRCDLYDSKLAAWRREDVKLPNASGKGKSKQSRTESLWMNYQDPHG